MNTIDPFTLEQLPANSVAPPVKAIEKTCGKCVHFQPHMSPDTGRAHPSLPGSCNWPKPEIIWPISYHSRGWGRLDETPRIYPNSVWNDTDAKLCQCWKPLCRAGKRKNLHADKINDPAL